MNIKGVCSRCGEPCWLICYIGGALVCGACFRDYAAALKSTT